MIFKPSLHTHKVILFRLRNTYLRHHLVSTQINPLLLQSLPHLTTVQGPLLLCLSHLPQLFNLPHHLTQRHLHQSAHQVEKRVIIALQPNSFADSFGESLGDESFAFRGFNEYGVYKFINLDFIFGLVLK